MKLWKMFLVTALVLVAVLALASCGCEHVYEEADTQEPTCIAEGVKTFTCTECGKSYTESIPTGEHAYTSKVTTQATCTADGVKTYTCTVCGDSYPEEIAKKEHNYTQTVVAANCQEGGYTTCTCTLCGDTYKIDETPKNDAHAYVSSVEPLTAEQAASNPDAIGVEVQTCSVCGEKNVTENAVLVFMDFNTVPTDVENYVGSEGYQNHFADAAASVVKDAITYIDQQAHTDATNYKRNDSGGMAMYGDGVLTKLNDNGYFWQDFKLGSANPTYTDTTISFDIIINKSPVGFSDTKYKTLQCFFAVADGSTYDSTVFSLCLNNVNLSSEVGVESAELYVLNRRGSGNEVWTDYATGYEVTIGKAYSFKVELSTLTAEKIYQGTVYVKADGEAEYTKLGTYDYVPNTGNNHGAISFGPFKHANGNIIDNYMLTTPLAK